jgi:GNAT superfamily N-acetyltransferase
VHLRPAVPADAEAVAALRRTVFSYLVMSAAQTRHMLTHSSPEERFQAYVAESGGELIGWAAGGLNTWTSQEGVGDLSLYVHPEHRGQGIGSALAEAAHAYLEEIGARRIRVFADPGGLEFARRRGYEGTRQLHYAGADLSRLPPQPDTPDGIEVVGVDELDPRQVYEADAVASLDEPGDAPIDAIEYDAWLREVWQAPALDRRVSVAAVVGDEVASVTMVEVDGDRAWSGMTGTIPAHRGRGLARLVKSVALRRAGAAGIRNAFTSNDDENKPMLAVNNWLGYRRVATKTCVWRTASD